MEENIARSNIESFKLSITKISQNRIDKYELVNIAKNLNIEISSAATFCIQKRMVLKELLSHVLRDFQEELVLAPDFRINVHVKAVCPIYRMQNKCTSLVSTLHLALIHRIDP